MKRTKESGAAYRNKKKKKNKEEFLMSYPKITSFTARAAAGPAFLTASEARVAAQDVYWREESRPDPVEESEEKLEFLLFAWRGVVKTYK